MVNAEKINLYEKAKSLNTVIKILGAPNNSTPGEEIEMEEVDGNTTETFTLEEFRNIIIDCRLKNIDFLIGRVTTPDPYDNSTLYNFYYAASEINKSLFKFESDRRLLHRMKVRNPLNNMFILGQVYYYKITLEDVDKSLIEYFFKNNVVNKRKNKIKAFSAIFRTKTMETKEMQHTKDANDSISSNSSVDSTSEMPIKEILKNCKVDLLPQKEISREKKLIHRARFFATDDDFLMQSEIRDYFRRNTLDKDDEFLFEIDRGQNDFFALLESGSEEENEEIVSWKRVLTAHVSLLITLLGICLLIGTSPLIILIAFPLALFFFFSFIGSMLYLLFCRRSTFDTLAVQSVEQV